MVVSKMADYIDRKELLGIEKLLDTEVLRASKTVSTIYDQMMYDIEHVPSADVAPVKRGKWIFDDNWWSFQCTECKGYVGNANKFDYCPHCGAEMDGDVNATD